MPLFSRFKNRGAQPASKKAGDADHARPPVAQPARWQSRWESKTIVPEEIAELVHLCTAEMKLRAEALDAPFMLLPFRIHSDPQGARTFIRNFYKSNAERSTQYRGESLKQELRLTDSLALVSIIKWCWSRMPNGVVSWPVYEAFRLGEKEARMARNAFDTFVPIGCDSDARRSIIVDFYDLLAAVAAHGKNNGLGGRKLSRMSGWWAFDHSDDGKGFEGGYKSWTSAAEASSHLFFAYLRSLSPDTNPSMNVIERIPRSLQALVASTEYPPETPTLLQRSTPRVVMLVDSVSPTPFALLRRAKNFEYRDKDQLLRVFSSFDDPLEALTEECKRVLYALSTANQSTVARSRQGMAKPEESWSAFQNLGFADIDEKAIASKSPNGMNGSTNTIGQGLRSEPRSRTGELGRPTTPSWADFLSSGFSDDGSAKSPTLLYPPAQVLPPLGSRASSPGLYTGDDEHLAPGELAAITNVELDDAFWWVWMTSLAGEEPSDRKAVFGRCAIIETTINGAWLIMEEQVKGASPDPVEAAYIAPKKSLFSFTKRGRLGRKRSVNKSPTQPQPMERVLSATPSKTSITNEQHAKIKAAARTLTLTKTQEETEHGASRRGRHEDGQSSKTNSMLTLGLQSEAGPAMKWATSYDKQAIRQQYLGDAFAGTGRSREDLVHKTSSPHLNGGASTIKTEASPVPSAVSTFVPEQRELPAVPVEQPSALTPEHEVPQKTQAPAAIEPSGSVATTVEPVVSAQQTQPGAQSGFDKERAVQTGSPKAKSRMDRKPLPQAVDHPAYRQQSVEETQPTTPVQNPAALAAAKAMKSDSPESVRSENKLKKQPGGGGGLKKFFGKKKESSIRGDSLDIQRPGSKGLAPPSEPGFGRRLSLMRKTQTSSSSPRASESQMAARAAVEQSTQEAMPSLQYAATDISRTSTHEMEAAEHEFSRFDQGPIDDMPSAIPADSETDPSPQPDEHRFTSFTHSQPQSQTQAGAVPDPIPRGNPSNDLESETTIDDHHDPQVVHDRWATIRENAHRRAEKQRQSEDQSTQSRPSRLTDDGETSGEETIESRVARIKARVAELTGNMETARH
ncbi:hypothetical protein AC579_5451 [Pseudocercospora musae]|uniref:Meiotically up-regulated protein Msb1/Mug8 domain-containing protein n=1 Tax=Pseudocercospora musae TaxID=113226 RepID=A0A139HJK8_9PEZI|nr:hypothetical protein AC579_5451 [Pseudocercospora musae]KXT02630.1 hypothetical protein AC579_5451 [Pseudocercospora musae]